MGHIKLSRNYTDRSGVNKDMVVANLINELAYKAKQTEKRIGLSNLKKLG